MAQIGATLLVAYGVEISWVLKESRLRDAGRENWVGIAVGLGCGGLVGIGLALALSGAGKTFSLAQELVFSVSVASISLLGFLVALGPFAVYEWAHAARAEYPDE
ncbi:MAG TPA: hypothetical protein VFX45_04700 [Solirubrobacterales bacterium]|nr:hypothetical protein [Solirubrobacterales bacterium]